MKLQHDIQLSNLTTIGLGGKAQHFVVVKSSDDLREALEHAKKENLEVHILGGGSNTIFPDKEFEKLVIKIDIQGVSFKENGGAVLVTAGAGEDWDGLVVQCIKKGYAGIEALSGIPGLVGATPIQNVGAYGQEVSNTIMAVKALDANSFGDVTFSNEECEFGYRTSRFKTRDAGKYIITEVTYHLIKDGTPAIMYPELQKQIRSELGTGRAALQKVRDVVLGLRKGKSMVIDSRDPNSKSCGSFFINPILTIEEFELLKQRADDDVPSFPAGDKVKVPAAWLIEHAGWKKGHQENGVGISENHSLAIINRGGTTKDLLALAEKIQESVEEKFGVQLEREPVVAE